MIVTIMQPAYLPWLGFFDRIARSDLFVCLDHVRIDHNTKTQFSNRNRIRLAQGSTWLTVPIRTAGQSDEGMALSRLEIAGEDWRRKHWRSIEQAYARAPYFAQNRPALQAIYERPWVRLADLCRELTDFLLAEFGIATPTIYSSALSSRSLKERLVLDICRETGASRYISGPFGRSYLDLDSFQDAGIQVLFHDYPHPLYRQAHAGFEPYMSALDLLLNHGPASLDILTSRHELPAR